MVLLKPKSREFSCLIIPLLTTIFVAFTLLLSSAHAQMDQIVHDTQGEFSLGTFDQTVLGGTETAPEIGVESYTLFSWSFEDYDIGVWGAARKGSLAIAEENPSGQIHLKAQRNTSVNESYALFYRTDVTVPNKFVVEYLIYFENIESSGVSMPGDPLEEQPTGACARLDVRNGTAGLRMDIFTDMMVSFWTRNSGIKDYPTIAYFNHTTSVGQWYTLRLDCDFTDLTVQVYLAGVWIGELLADTRNSGSSYIRPMAYSREIGGVGEVYIDYVKLGTATEEYYAAGTYTSAALDLGATSLGALSWIEAEITYPYPWGEWTKYSGNPVLNDTTGPGDLPENILTDINDPLQQPLLFRHPTSLEYKYWLVIGTCCGHDIRLAYSDDLFNWTPYEGNPILSPGSGESYLFSPNIFKDGNTYYLFYDVAIYTTGPPARWAQRVAYATASSPFGPWTKGPVILELGSDGEWDEGRVSEPFVFKDGDTYYLFYMGDTYSYGSREQIGLATTSSASFPLGEESGGLWTKYGLILPHNPDPGAWDSGLTADPSVIKVGDTFYMLYTGSYANVNWKLGIAWSDSPYGPWNRPSSPNLFPGPDSWDSNRLVRGAIHYHDGKYFMPYAGRGSRYQGGIATADPVDLVGLIDFETSTSPDGATWEGWQPVSNGSSIQSTPNRYFQYRATLALSSVSISPVLTSVTVNYQTYIEVTIDIKPGPTALNCIKDTSKGKLPVAILGSEDFDVTCVDVSTVKIDDDDDPLTDGVYPWSSSYKDINEDGVTDLVLHFKTQDCSILFGDDKTLFITGQTTGGDNFRGSDLIYLTGGPHCLD
jgi:hypothetical protein